MRILILHNKYQHLGGEDIVVQQEANALKNKGHEVLILTDKNRRGLKGVLQFLFYPFNFWIKQKLFNTINSFNPEVIHIHNIHYAIGPYLIKKLKQKGYPVVMTMHNFRLICPSATLFYQNKTHTESIAENFPWTAVKAKALDNSFLKSFITAFTYYIHRKTWQQIDRFIVMTKFSKQIFLDSNLGLSETNITVKPNFVELSNPPIHNKRENHFLYIGRVSEEKGVRQLVSHFLNTDHLIKVIGDGPIAEELKNITKHSKNIHWLGHRNKSEIQDEISRCQAVIVPSVCFEGAVPLTILESIVLRTPVIASEIGAISELIKNNNTGWTFDPYSQESLFNAINNFKQHKDKDSIVENAIKVILVHYQRKTVIEELINIYQQIVT